MKLIFKGLLLLTIALLMLSCEQVKQSDSSEEGKIKKTTVITESDVVGFYTGRGLYNAANATIELYYGGSYIMEDPFLPSGGSAFGKWVFKGSLIDFYMDGQKIFTAQISKSSKGNTIHIRGIIIRGQRWEKIR